MGVRTNQFIANIQTVLVGKTLTTREIFNGILDLKLHGGGRRKVVPTFMQVVGLLTTNPEFILVKEEPQTRGRSIKYWRNKNAMD